MKTWITLCLLCYVAPGFAQTLTGDDLGLMVPSLKSEDWESVHTTAAGLLDQHGREDTSWARAALLYMNLYAAAGMVTEDKMSFDELAQKAKKFEGQYIRMPGHPVTTKDGALSQIKFTVTDSTAEAFTAAANDMGTNILCFERFYLKNKINPDEFPPRSFAGCAGILQKAEINPRKSKIWILRLTISDAVVRKTE